MLRSESRMQELDLDIIIGNDDALNDRMITNIEIELRNDPYDMISLLFLLYDDPITALRRLTVFERVSKDIGSSTNQNMLLEWFRQAKHTLTWKYQFIEALLLCQLNSIVKLMGFHVPTARNHYQIDNMHSQMFINPVMKSLYKLCENTTTDNLLTLKKALLTYDINVQEYESCELVLLKLICDKFITVHPYQYNKKTLGYQIQMEKLLRIIETLPGLRNCAQEMRLMQRRLNEESTLYSMLGEVSVKGKIINSLNSDTTKLQNDSFKIKNYASVGVCVILNQTNFYPSKYSLQNCQVKGLAKRSGSDKDQAIIEKTMEALNFRIYSAKDLNHKEIFYYLADILKTKVSDDDSVFMLFILSHGVKGHIYAADSVKVNVDEIQQLLESDVALRLHDKPKVLIIQACQSDDTLADSTQEKAGNKTNFITYWATAPALEAYRDKCQGSIFIQTLCSTIMEYANKELTSDIFTKVTNKVTRICENLGYTQVPICLTTATKKLYLKTPQ